MLLSSAFFQTASKKGRPSNTPTIKNKHHDTQTPPPRNHRPTGARARLHAVEGLARTLGVTAQTVRRDIGELCETGLLRRYHGGATPRRGRAERRLSVAEKPPPKRKIPPRRPDCGANPRRRKPVRRHRRDHGSRGRRAGRKPRQPAHHHQQHPRRRAGLRPPATTPSSSPPAWCVPWTAA